MDSKRLPSRTALTEIGFPVLFNPEEYTLSKDNNFAQIAVPGLRAPLLQFVSGNMQTLKWSCSSIRTSATNRAGASSTKPATMCAI